MKINEILKRLANKTFRNQHRVVLNYNNHNYEIIYHKAWFWWQEKFTLKGYIKNIYTNHWEANHINKSGSKINCMGNGSGIIYGFFQKRKMKKQLLACAKYWQQYLKEV